MTLNWLNSTLVLLILITLIQCRPKLKYRNVLKYDVKTRWPPVPEYYPICTNTLFVLLYIHYLYKNTSKQSNIFIKELLLVLTCCCILILTTNIYLCTYIYCFTFRCAKTDQRHLFDRLLQTITKVLEPNLTLTNIKFHTVQQPVHGNRFYAN